MTLTNPEQTIRFLETVLGFMKNASILSILTVSPVSVPRATSPVLLFSRTEPFHRSRWRLTHIT